MFTRAFTGVYKETGVKWAESKGTRGNHESTLMNTKVEGWKADRDGSRLAG